MFFSNFVPKMHHFWDIRLVITQWPWSTGYGSLKVIGTDTYWSITFDFLLTFHNNHEPISYRFRDRRWFQSKIANFSHPRVFNAPADGVPLGIGHRRKGQKTRMMGLVKGRKSFKIVLAVLIQYRRVTDSQPAKSGSITQLGGAYLFAGVVRTLS